MIDVLIVGGDSTIGSELTTLFEAEGNPTLSTTCFHSNVNDKCLFLDLSDDMDNWPMPPEPIKTAIICAAVTSQEQCQLNPDYSWRVNVGGTVALATRMVEAGAFVIFLSSNAVFNGESPFASPDDPVTPQTEYGRQKAEAEDKLLKLGDKVAIVRFSKVIFPEIPLIKGWIRNLKAGNIIHPFSDMVIAPVPVAFAVSVLREVAISQTPGIIQVSAQQEVTYADLARHIAQRLGSDEGLVKPISYKDNGITSAPRNTTLDTSRLADFDKLPPEIWMGVDKTFGLY